VNLQRISLRVERAGADRRINRQVDRVERYLDGTHQTASGEGPVLFFNASTRIHTLSLNAAFSLLASWSVRAAGVPVLHVVCQAGMEQCVLGTHATGRQHPPPCDPCMRFSQHLFPTELVIPLARPGNVGVDLGGQSLETLARSEYHGFRLGELCLPGLRWALRRHHLADDAPSRLVFAQYLRSAAHLVDEFSRILESTRPRAMVVFNGVMYPEAVARAVAAHYGIPVVSHEVGLRPFSAFFSHNHATFRELDLPRQELLELGWEELVDAYLEQRRRGKFSMAGIEFWPRIKALPEQLTDALASYRQMIPIFTNVVFDTSQSHANTVFEDMFDWLEALVPVITSRPETLFVLRAHPDEDRPGKVSRESVADWFRRSPLNGRANVVLIEPSEYVSSYELVDRAKCVLVYSSSVGLEASALGIPVLCAGRARYTQSQTVVFPASRQGYLDQLARFLSAERLEVSEQTCRNAKAFLYHELYRASLDLGEFLQPYRSMPGMVMFSEFDPQKLTEHPALAVIRDGVQEGKPFELSPRSAWTSAQAEAVS
jgi:hypothetical protein